MTRLVYAMPEKRLAKGKAELSPELVALGAAAVALHKSLTAFLAVERLCE